VRECAPCRQFKEATDKCESEGATAGGRLVALSPRMRRLLGVTEAFGGEKNARPAQLTVRPAQLTVRPAQLTVRPAQLTLSDRFGQRPRSSRRSCSPCRWKP
jgi:hypothetical protein